MTREQIEAEVFRMVKEDIEATDDEIRDAIDVTSDNEPWSQCPFCNSKFYFNDEDRFAFCPRCQADLTEEEA